MAFPPWHFLALLSLFSAVAAFNLATDLPRLLTGPKGTNFGYSVALWASHSQHLRLVVGAPRGTNSTFGNGSIPLGNIHMCEPSTEQCEADTNLPTLQERDNSRRTLEFASVRKQGIGFGETLLAADFLGSNLVVCAPRFTTIFTRMIQLRGACYVLQDPLSSAQRLSLFRGTPVTHKGSSLETSLSNFINRYDYTGYGMAGFSIIMDMNQTSFFVGLPFAFYGQGSVTRLSNPEQSNEDQMYTRVSAGENPDPDYSHEGWAVALGLFDGRKEILAVSIPNPGTENGMVMLLDTETLEPIQVPPIKNDILGAKFGFSLASGDFDGDGASDLVVGAPLSPGADGAPDAGRIYVFYAPAKNVSQKSPELLVKGQLSWGRFGHAVASLGDVNQDGFEDLAVGAPASGDGGRVYVFNGRNEGLNPVASQVLRASDFGPGLRGFGFSVDGGIDMDGNGYPDVIIGAVESDAAVFIRSAPLLQLEGNVTFDPAQINANNKSCEVNDSSGQAESVVCFEIVTKLRYSALKWNESQSANVSLVLDSKMGRLAFMENKQTQLTYQTNLTTSFEEKRFLVYVQPVRQSINTILEVDASVTLLRATPPSQAAPGLVPVPPIFDPHRLSAIRGKGFLFCEDPLTCFSRPDLVLQGPKLQRMVLGRDVRIDLLLHVKQDTAYDVVLKIFLPNIFSFGGVSGSRQIPECERSASSENKTSCRFLTKLRKDIMVPLTFVFESSPLSVLEFLSSVGRNEVPVMFEVHSDIADIEPSDNVLQLEVAVDLDHQIHGLGISFPDSLTAFANPFTSLLNLTDPESVSQASPTDLGPQVIHAFVLSNQGSSPVVNSKMVIQIPNGQLPLLQIVNVASVPPLICSHPTLNQLDLQVEDGNDTSPKDFLETTNHTGVLRVRRAANMTNSTHESHKDVKDATSQRVLSCDNIGCVNITCDLPPLVDGVTVAVNVTAHLVVATFENIRPNSVILESLLSIEIPEILGNPETSSPVTTLRLPVTIFRYSQEQHPGLTSAMKYSHSVLNPLWYLALAVLSGFIIVILIMGLLHMLGFFKRKRPYMDLKKEEAEQLAFNDFPTD